MMCPDDDTLAALATLPDSERAAIVNHAASCDACRRIVSDLLGVPTKGETFAAEGGCVQPDEIHALLSGELPEAAVERVEIHLDACSGCRKLVGELAKDSVYARSEVPIGDAPTITPPPSAPEDPRDASAAGDTEPTGTDATVDVASPPLAPKDDRASRPSFHRLRPSRIGRYLIEKRIGVGGMGIVFLADDPELRRKVVIKLLRADPDFQHSARLQREAQAMAKVSHANVVPIYDVGVHEHQVFLAMEFMDGGDLATWLKQPRTVGEILEAFIAAGRGLAAAHRAGLVHRDFKPHNVMRSSVGDVKVTDFGLACADVSPVAEGNSAGGAQPDRKPRRLPRLAGAVDSEMLESRLTDTGALIGTPAYMAPEQILADEVDARSDQFSFCIALYEALYGERPFRGKTLTELFDSTLEGLDERQLQGIARRRGVPVRVRDAIRRGLRKKPDDRFASMDMLLAELAPRTSGTAIAAAVLGGAALLSIGAVWLLSRDEPSTLCTGGATELADVWNPQRRTAIESAFLATREHVAPNAFAVVAKDVDRYTESWLDGHRDACEATHMRGEQTDEGMDRRMRCLRQRRTELDALLEVLTRPDPELLKEATAIVSRLTSPVACANAEALASDQPEPSKAAEVQALEGKLARGVAQMRAIRLDVAQAQLAETLGAAERLGYKPLIAEAQLQVGLLALQKMDYVEAENRLHRAVEIAEEARVDRVRAVAFTYLVTATTSNNKLDDADRWARYAQSTIERLGNDRTLLAELDLRIGEIKRGRGDAKGAEATYLRAIERLGAVHGPNSREVAFARRDLASAYMDVNDYERAFEQHRTSREILRSVLGAEHPEVTATTGLMSVVRHVQHRNDEAMSLGMEELGAMEKFYGTSHPLVAQSYESYAQRLQAIGRSEEAVKTMEKAVAIMEVRYAEKPLHASMLGSLALIYSNMNRIDEAYDTWAHALAIYTTAFKGESNADAVQLLNVMGTMRRRQGRFDEALALYNRARVALEKFQQPNGRLHADTLTRIGTLENGRKRWDDAILVLEKALASRIAAGATPSLVSWTKFELAQALWDGQRDRNRALVLAREALRDAQTDADQPQVELVEKWLAGKG